MHKLIYLDENGNELRDESIKERGAAYERWDAVVASPASWPNGAKTVSLTDGPVRSRSFTRVDPIPVVPELSTEERLDVRDAGPSGRTPGTEHLVKPERKQKKKA